MAKRNHFIESSTFKNDDITPLNMLKKVKNNFRFDSHPDPEWSEMAEAKESGGHFISAHDLWVEHQILLGRLNADELMRDDDSTDLENDNLDE